MRKQCFVKFSLTYVDLVLSAHLCVEVKHCHIKVKCCHIRRFIIHNTFEISFGKEKGLFLSNSSLSETFWCVEAVSEACGGRSEAGTGKNRNKTKHKVDENVKCGRFVRARNKDKALRIEFETLRESHTLRVNVI